MNILFWKTWGPFSSISFLLFSRMSIIFSPSSTAYLMRPLFFCPFYPAAAAFLFLAQNLQNCTNVFHSLKVYCCVSLWRDSFFCIFRPFALIIELEEINITSHSHSHFFFCFFFFLLSFSSSTPTPPLLRFNDNRSFRNQKSPSVALPATLFDKLVTFYQSFTMGDEELCLPPESKSRNSSPIKSIFNKKKFGRIRVNSALRSLMRKDLRWYFEKSVI